MLGLSLGRVKVRECMLKGQTTCQNQNQYSKTQVTVKQSALICGMVRI